MIEILPVTEKKLRILFQNVFEVFAMFLIIDNDTMVKGYAIEP